MARKFKIKDSDPGFRNFRRKITRGVNAVNIGIFGDQGSDLVKIAATHEFGSTIEHKGTPGGVSFGFKTRRAAIKGKVRFLKKGEGFLQLGTTKASGAFEIKIPERSFLRSTIDENRLKFKRFFNKHKKEMLQGPEARERLLKRLGLFAEKKVAQKIRKGPFTPNKPSTVRKKGSSKPLIDTGRMRQAVTSRVVRI